MTHAQIQAARDEIDTFVYGSPENAAKMREMYDIPGWPTLKVREDWTCWGPPAHQLRAAAQMSKPILPRQQSLSDALYHPSRMPGESMCRRILVEAIREQEMIAALAPYGKSRKRYQNATAASVFKPFGTRLI